MPTPLPWETWKATEPLSYLNTGLGILGLPGDYARGVIGSIPALFGRGPSHVGERLSGEELAQAFGWEKPGALGGMAMGLVTDPSMLAGPAIHLARSIAGGAQAAKAASTAAQHSVPFLKSAAFNIGAPLAGAAVYDANREYANPVADALASGLMAAPLATMGASMAIKGARGLGKALTPKDVPASQESIASRRNFMKQIGAGAASAAMEGPERLVKGASLKPRPVAPTETGPTLEQMRDAFEQWDYSDSGRYPTVFEIAGREGMQHPTVGKYLRNIGDLDDKLSHHMVELGDALDDLDLVKARAAYQKTQDIERVMDINEGAAWDSLNKYESELEALKQANRAADRARWNANRAASDAASRRSAYGLPWQENPLVPYQPPSEGVLPVGTPPLNQLAGQGSLAPPATIPLPAPMTVHGDTAFKQVKSLLEHGRKGVPEQEVIKLLEDLPEDMRQEALAAIRSHEKTAPPSSEKRHPILSALMDEPSRSVGPSPPSEWPLVPYNKLPQEIREVLPIPDSPERRAGILRMRELNDRMEMVYKAMDNPSLSNQERERLQDLADLAYTEHERLSRATGYDPTDPSTILPADAAEIPAAIPVSFVTPRESISHYYENLLSGGGVDEALRAAKESKQQGLPWNFSNFDRPVATFIEHTPSGPYSGRYHPNDLGRPAARLNTGNMSEDPGIRAEQLRATLAHEVGTHSMQPDLSGSLITWPDKPYRRGNTIGPDLDEYPLKQTEAEAAVIGPVKRLYAKATGNLVRTPQDAEKALEWLAQYAQSHDVARGGEIDHAAKALADLVAHSRYESTIKPYLTSRMPGILSFLPWILPFAGASLASQQENQ
jgi:hypothetical protein